jgi:cysteinyl-tRNA synthetase
MQLYLYNTLTKKKELFTPINPNKIGMYVCGPTVYDYPHLGNALAVVIYDVLFRLLQNLYGEDKVIYVRNITDVDDKIINAAHEQKISVGELTNKITNIFQSNMQALNCLNPSMEPKATEHIAEMIEITKKLLDNDHAYIQDDHVYFRVHKFKDYGKLSGRKLEDLVAGSRVEIAQAKENPEDFVLWKPAKDIDHCFASPFGTGRPGWHIECSAMSSKYLGNDFDIHGGGIDLIFPHHTNEIAQSCCAHPGSAYAKVWVHNGFLTVNGEKMSKSLGNFITTAELLNKGIKGEVIRYILLNSHYRKPIDWNDKAISDSNKALNSFYRVIAKIEDNSDAIEIPEEFYQTLLDDLNTPQSFALLHEYAHQFNKTNDIKYALILKACGKLLGFFEGDIKAWFNDANIDTNYIEKQIQERHLAKQNKNWQEADRIRNSLKDQGIALEDLADGKSIWKKLY